MAADKMHSDEVETNIPLVRRLLATQFPQWADLPIKPIHSDGTSNAIYRLGDDLSVRLPLIGSTTLQHEKEHEWLPRLAPHLPLALPVPLAKGEPTEDYPFLWSVYTWLRGDLATPEHLTSPDQAATDLAAFISALREIDTTGGPAPGKHNFHRGVPLAARDATVRTCIEQLEGVIDTDAATGAWEAALAAPTWNGPPTWIHGDLSATNLLATDGRLTAAIDWGGLGVGDPACELFVAWDLFPRDARETFRTALDIGDATWDRGRGWALSLALIGLPYYIDTNPGFTRYARRLLDEALADHNATS